MVISHFSHRCFSNSNRAPQLTLGGGDELGFLSFFYFFAADENSYEWEMVNKIHSTALFLHLGTSFGYKAPQSALPNAVFLWFFFVLVKRKISKLIYYRAIILTVWVSDSEIWLCVYTCALKASLLRSTPTQLPTRMRKVLSWFAAKRCF